jgi:hypothetical protein
MRFRLLGLILFTVLLSVPAAAGAASKGRPHAHAPSVPQIRSAVRKAERSSDLWATVNTCNSVHHPNTIGIRGQMPALGFKAGLQMTFGVDYFSQANDAFLPLDHVSQKLTLGEFTRGVHQEGVSFTFSPHAGLLRGRVRFEWRFAGKPVGHVTRLTRLGHRNADYGDPKGFSSWKCDIP